MDWGIGDTYSILLTFIKLDVFIFVQKDEWVTLDFKML